MCRKKEVYDDIDYVILVGYLENKDSYLIADLIRCKNQNVRIIQWAMLDNYIISIAVKYRIYFMFDGLKPAGEFLEYLDLIKEKNDSTFFDI